MNIMPVNSQPKKNEPRTEMAIFQFCVLICKMLSVCLMLMRATCYTRENLIFAILQVTYLVADKVTVCYGMKTGW